MTYLNLRVEIHNIEALVTVKPFLEKNMAVTETCSKNLVLELLEQ